MTLPIDALLYSLDWLEHLVSRLLGDDDVDIANYSMSALERGQAHGAG